MGRNYPGDAARCHATWCDLWLSQRGRSTYRPHMTISKGRCHIISMLVHVMSVNQNVMCGRVARTDVWQIACKLNTELSSAPGTEVKLCFELHIYDNHCGCFDRFFANDALRNFLLGWSHFVFRLPSFTSPHLSVALILPINVILLRRGLNLIIIYNIFDSWITAVMNSSLIHANC